MGDRSVFGFTGWCCFKIWQSTMLFLPSSPLYAYLDRSWALTVALVAVFVAPYGLSCVFAGRLSSMRSLGRALAAAWVCLIVGLVVQLVRPDAVVLKVCLLSLTMWGLHLAWQPYASTLRALRLVGARSMVASAVFLGLVFVDPSSAEVIIWVLPFLSILALAAHDSFEQKEELVFATKRQVHRDADLFIHNPIWIVFQSSLQGIGVGMLFAAGLASSECLAFVGAGVFLGALTLMAASRVLLDISKPALLVATVAVMAPLLVVAAGATGYALAAIGAFALFLGRLQQGIDVRERFKQPYLSVFHFGRNHALEMACVGAGAVLACSLFCGAADLRLAFALAVSYGAAIAGLVYFLRVIASYEHFIYEEDNARKRLLKADFDGAEDGSWIRKVECVARSFDLSPRQVEVLRLLSYGRNAESISKELFISHSTAKSHIYTIYKKTGVHTQQELLDLIQTQNHF